MELDVTLDDVVALHKKYAPSQAAFDLIFTHCTIVWEIARQLLDAMPASRHIDRKAVELGCLLHDMGVYRLYLANGEIDHASYIKHGILGYELLKAEGFPEWICRFASCHTGVGLSKEEIEREGLPLPPADYFAQTPEERLLMYADKFHTKTSPPQLMTAAAYEAFTARFGPENVRRFKAMQQEFGIPELEPFAKAYGLHIVAN